MKKLIAFVLTLVMVLGVTAVAFANPGQNPNNRPGGAEMEFGDYTVRVTGGGNNLVIDILRDGAVVYPRVPRAGNGTFSQVFTTTSGHEIFINVRGNSLIGFSVTAPVPYVVKEYSFRQFVEYNQVDSLRGDWVEVVGSRAVVNVYSHDAHQYHMGQSSDPRTNNVTGNGARITEFNATTTLNFLYQFNYTEQFERIYEWVDVTVWSNGVREEVVREGSLHPYGDLVLGLPYLGEELNGSTEFSTSYSGSILLHMGNQGLPSTRYFSYANGAITVDIVLQNTGNPPSVLVLFTVDVNALTPVVVVE